jgi:hypothetical protein
MINLKIIETITRVSDLVYKMASVKGLFVIVTTIAFFQGHISEVSFLLAWIVFIGARHFEKPANIVNSLRGLGSQTQTEGKSE